MQTYVDVIRFNFLRYSAYPIEVIGNIGNSFGEFFLLLLFWYVVSVSSHNAIKLTDIISYLIIANSVNVFVMTEHLPFGVELKNAVILGTLSNYMIKPLSLMRFLYADFVGQIGVSFILSFVMLIIGIIINPPMSFLSIFLFLLLLIPAIFISLSFNIFVGVIAFYTTEVTNIKNVMNHVLGIFSGLIIPLTYFPHGLREIVLMTPFPYMVYAPVHVLQAKVITQDIRTSIFLAYLWAGILFFLVSYLWNRGIKKYEAVGM